MRSIILVFLVYDSKEIWLVKNPAPTMTDWCHNIQ